MRTEWREKNGAREWSESRKASPFNVMASSAAFPDGGIDLTVRIGAFWHRAHPSIYPRAKMERDNMKYYRVRADRKKDIWLWIGG
jgi:hypothetical protein